MREVRATSESLIYKEIGLCVVVKAHTIIFWLGPVISSSMSVWKLAQPLATLETPLSLQLIYLVLFPKFSRRCDPHQHRSNATFIIFGDSNRALAVTKPDGQPRRPSSG